MRRKMDRETKERLKEELKKARSLLPRKIYSIVKRLVDEGYELWFEEQQKEYEFVNGFFHSSVSDWESEYEIIYGSADEEVVSVRENKVGLYAGGSSKTVRVIPRSKVLVIRFKERWYSIWEPYVKKRIYILTSPEGIQQPL